MIQATKHDREDRFQPSADLLSSMKHLGRTREEQIAINQQGLDLLKKWREEELTEEELQADIETWKDIKEIIDRERDRKLFC